MIYQIATRCGLPPRVIAESWSPEELQNAVVLAKIEGWGRSERLVARICAEIHNAQMNASYLANAAPNSKPPKQLTERNFLPRKIYKRKLVSDPSANVQPKADKVAKFLAAQKQVIASMAGY